MKSTFGSAKTLCEIYRNFLETLERIGRLWLGNRVKLKHFADNIVVGAPLLQPLSQSLENIKSYVDLVAHYALIDC